ncbi:hypothetical protein ACVIHF_006931 [Bradyrhizobium sp. USDA 4506]
MRFDPDADCRQEVRGAAAHQHVGLRVEILRDDRVIGGAAAGMRNHRRRGRVLDLGVGDDADGEARPALGKTRDGLDPRIVKRIGRAIGVDAERIDRGLVAGGVGARGIRRIGDDRVRAGGRDQRHMRHVVDRELAAALALRDSLGEDSRGDAMRRRHPVADEQDHVPGLSRLGVVDGPGHLPALRAVTDFDGDLPGLDERDIAQHQRRLLPAGLVRGECAALAEHRGIVRAVQRDLELCLIDHPRKLDLEVEFGADEDIGAIDRIDRLGERRRCRQRQRDGHTGNLLDHDRCSALAHHAHHAHRSGG